MKTNKPQRLTITPTNLETVIERKPKQKKRKRKHTKLKKEKLDP